MRDRLRAARLAAIAALVVACKGSSEPAGKDGPAPSASSASAAPVAALSARISRPAAARVVAIGDLHGDLDHARRAFTLAGAIGPDGHWSGGALVVVQTGDEIDRGDDDRAIVDQVETWKREAKAAGGELIALDGNHELMNAKPSTSATSREGGFKRLRRRRRSNAPASALPAVPARSAGRTQRGRAAAFCSRRLRTRRSSPSGRPS